jgi:hypothetical protein
MNNNTYSTPFNPDSYYLVRGTGAGLYIAKIAAIRGDEYDLLDARMIHYYANAASVVGIATGGLAPNSRITLPHYMTIRGVCQHIELSEEVAKQILGVEPWQYKNF